MKKRFLFGVYLSLFVAVCTIGFCGCNSGNNGENDSENTNEIELTLDNYKYYLTITSYLKDSGSYGGGTYRYASYDVYISGAINGIYQGCVLYFKNEKKLTLDAGGNAQTERSVVNGEDSFTVEKVEGKIILYN